MCDRKKPVRRISVASTVIGETEKRYVADWLDSSWISSIGTYLSRFEEAFAEFCEVKHAFL
jgi:perosamine synthetase